jgi:hypothetical protein
MVFMVQGRDRIGACSWGSKGDQAREENSKKSFELTAKGAEKERVSGFL